MLSFLIILVTSICIQHVSGTLLDGQEFETFFEYETCGKKALPGHYRRIESVEEKIALPEGYNLKRVIRGTVPANWSLVDIWKHSTFDSYVIAREFFERQYRFRWVYRSSRGTIIDDTDPKFPILKWTVTKDVLQEMHATDRRQKALLEVASTKADESVSQKEHQEQINTITEERDTAISALQESRIEIDRLKSQLFEATNRTHSANQSSNQMEHNDKDWKSLVFWCCIFGVIYVLVMFFIFCIYHRHRLRKDQREIDRLQTVVSLNSVHRKQGKESAILGGILGREKVHNEGKQNQDLNAKYPIKERGDGTNSKYGESFGDLVQNMDGVQGAMMNDIVDEIVTEGQEESNEIAEGDAVTHVVGHNKET